VHLGTGDPAAWRAGLRVLELAYGPAPPTPSADDVQLPTSADDVNSLGWRELQVVAARLFAEAPTGNSVDATVMNGAEAVVVNSGTGLAG
jgi:hypothetical protein